MLCFLGRPEVAGGEALAGLLRKGGAGSNTAADHVTVLDMALASLPAYARPRPGDPDGPRLLARSDSAGATHVFAQACRDRGVGFSFGFPVDARVQSIVDETEGHPATRSSRSAAPFRSVSTMWWEAGQTSVLPLSVVKSQSRMLTAIREGGAGTLSSPSKVGGASRWTRWWSEPGSEMFEL